MKSFTLMTSVTVFLFGSFLTNAIDANPVSFQKEHWYNDGIKTPVWQRVDQYIELELSFNTARNKSKFQEQTYRVKPLPENVQPSQIPVWRKRHLSPIYQTSPNSDATRMALTGNIIIHFMVDWTKQQVTDFMSGYETGGGIKLPIGKNIYLFQSETVSDSLALANAIYKSGKVIEAYPDWMVLEPAR